MSTQNDTLKPLFEGNITINLNDPEVQEILSTQCPTASQVAEVLRARGHVIKRKIETEQGVVIAWMLSLYRDHGMGWREAGAKHLRGIQDWLRAEDCPILCDCGGEPHGKGCALVINNVIPFEDHAAENGYSNVQAHSQKGRERGPDNT